MQLAAACIVGCGPRARAVPVWPEAQADAVDIERDWSYAVFRAARLEAFVRDVVLPCALEFDDEERAAWRAATQALWRRAAGGPE